MNVCVREALSPSSDLGSLAAPESSALTRNAPGKGDNDAEDAAKGEKEVEAAGAAEEEEGDVGGGNVGGLFGTYFPTISYLN